MLCCWLDVKEGASGQGGQVTSRGQERQGDGFSPRAPRSSHLGRPLQTSDPRAVR